MLPKEKPLLNTIQGGPEKYWRQILLSIVISVNHPVYFHFISKKVTKPERHPVKQMTNQKLTYSSKYLTQKSRVEQTASKLGEEKTPT